MTEAKAIFFDLDETLIENTIPVPQLFVEAFEPLEDEYGASKRDDVLRSFRKHINGLWESMFEVEDSPESQLIRGFSSAIEEACEIPASEAGDYGLRIFDNYIRLSRGSVRFHDGAVEILAWLREQGFITGLITNGIEALQSAKIEQLEIATMVDHVTISAQARAHKPHRPVFDLALSRAGVSAEHAWQIGDHATNDVAGAIRAGMSGVFYNPKGLNSKIEFAELEENPCHEITHLLHITNLLEAS